MTCFDRVALCAMTAGWCLASPLAAQGTSSVATENAVRIAAIDQANAEYGLRQGSKPKLYREVDFAVHLIRADDSVSVYRVLVQSSDNRHPYTLMVISGQLVRLGGFRAPALIDAARILCSHRPIDNLWDCAYDLARLADLNGAQQFVSPITPDSVDEATVVRRRWVALVDSAWPPNSLSPLPNGRQRMTFTVFSRAVQDYVDGWDPILYTMVFSPTGQLEAWDSRTGQRFSER